MAATLFIELLSTSVPLHLSWVLLALFDPRYNGSELHYSHTALRSASRLAQSLCGVSLKGLVAETRCRVSLKSLSEESRRRVSLQSLGAESHSRVSSQSLVAESR